MAANMAKVTRLTFHCHGLSKAFALHTDHPNALNPCRVTAILA
jgi:hypothetical protein